MSAVQAFWKHCGKRRIARNEQFLLFLQCFLPVYRTFCHYHPIWNCRLQTLSVWHSPRFVVWERVKNIVQKEGKAFEVNFSLCPCFTNNCSYLIWAHGHGHYKNIWRNLKDLCVKSAPPGWLSGERVGLMTWWLGVRSPVEATFLSGVFSPLTSAEAYEKSSRWLWKEKLC